jgi:succinate dehydrogenase / fumarate reductase, membrane anchor subunit
MRTALGQVRGLGSAKKGTGDFIASRVTSVALAILTIPFVFIVAASWGRSYEDALLLLGSPLVAIVLIAAILLTTVHMRLGMQVVIEDYVHTELPKFVLLIANFIFAWAIGLAAVFAVLKIAFGA